MREQGHEVRLIPRIRYAPLASFGLLPQFHIINKVILIGRLGQNAEAKTAQNNREYVILNIATQESWKNDKGDYERRACVRRAGVL